MPEAATSRERCFDGVHEVFKCDESQSNSLVQEGKSDCRGHRSRYGVKQLVEGTCPLFEAMCLATDVVNEGGHRPKERSWPRGDVGISTQ